MEVGSKVVAIFDFETTEPGELALKAGDEVEVTSRIDENWIAGTCNGKSGTFPANFVKPADETSSNISNKKVAPYQVTAIQDYDSSTAGDLSFKKGDVITVSHQIDEHWLQGSLGEQSGIFPLSYVTKDSSQQHTNQSATQEYQARAIQNVTGQLSEELTFMIGDIITITGKVDEDWLKGTLNGQSGVLPAICVQALDSNSLNGPKTEGTNQGSDLNFDALDKAFQGSSTTTAGATGERPKAKTLYPFSAERDCELSFMDGETIYLRARVDENWLEGELEGNVGLFPAEFVEIIVDIPPGYVPPEVKSKNVSSKQGKASGNPVLSSSSTQGEVAVVKPQLLDVGQGKGVPPIKGRRGKVLYDFNPETEHDVAAKQGDIVTIVSKPDNEWYEAKNPAGKVGFIPIAYVQLLEKPRTPSFKRPAPQPPGVKPSKKCAAPGAPNATSSDKNANELFSLDQLGTLESQNSNKPAKPSNPKPSSGDGGGLDDLLFFDPLVGGDDPPLAPTKPSAHAPDPSLPHAYKPGGSSFKPVSFAGKSSANTATVAPMTTEPQSSAPTPPPQPTRGNSLLDMSPVDKPMSPVMMPMAPVSSTSSEPKPAVTKQESLDSLSKFDILAARPFNPSSSKQIRSVQRPMNRGSSSSSIDAKASIQATAAPSGGSEPMDPELLTISQVNQDLDRALLEGASPNAGSGLLTLSQVNSDLDRVIQEGGQDVTPNFNAAFSSESDAVGSAPFSSGQDDYRPPVPPRQPSPNPFAAAVEEQQTEIQPTKPSSSNPFSAVTPPGEMDNSFANSFDPIQSIPDATLPRDDSIPSDMSDDAFAQGINFTINSPLSVSQENPPTTSSFKLPPPPSPGKRPTAPPKPQKFDPRTAVPRPRPRSSVENIEAALAPPPAPSQKPALPPKPDLDLLTDSQRAANPELANFEASIQQIFDTSKWETEEMDVSGQPPPTAPPPVTRGASLLDQDLGVISQVLQQHPSSSKAQPSQAAVGDLLGIGGVEETAPPQSKPSRPAPARPAMPAKRKVPPGRPVPPRLGPGMQKDENGAMNGEAHTAEVANLESTIAKLKEEIETQRLQKSNLVRECAFVTVEKDKAELQQQIADEELDILEKEKQLKTLQGQLAELMPEPTPAPKMTPADFREKVVKELLKTEDDYVRDIKLCQEGFMTVLQENQVIISEILIAQAEEENEELERSGEKKKAAKGLELDVLFGNMEQVIEVAESFLHDIEETAQKPVEDQLFGKIFMDHSRNLHEAYAQYCRNHDDASALLEKYEENPEVQEYINQGLELVRQSTNCWDLASFLIKPVQRILKYHLLIAELYKYTEEDHQDRSTLKLALATMTEVATDINEFKRRKDLVLKYRHRGQEAITDKLGKINLHSLRKKSQRINQRFTQMTGLGTQTIDEEFDRAERRFHTLEKTIKIFVKDVHAYLEQLKEATSVEATVGSDISDYYANQSNLHEVNKYEAVQNHLANKLYKDYTLFVQQRVMSPLNSLLNMFQGPHKLIQKRYDKLLDYDSYINKAEKTKDKDRTKQYKYKKKEGSSDEDDDVPLSPRRSSTKRSKSKHKKKELDSDDDEATTVGSPRRLKEKVSKETKQWLIRKADAKDQSLRRRTKAWNKTFDKSKHKRLTDSASEDEATTVGAPRRLKERHPREVKDEKEVARKNYEALNIQLKDELPRLCAMSMALFKCCVISFIEAERDHINSTLKRLYPLIELSIVKSTDMSNIMSDFETSHQEASEGMLVYSFVPRNFDRKVDKSERKSKKPYSEPKVPASKPPSSKAQSEAQRQSVLTRYSTGRVYQVKTNFIAQQPMDISVYKGNIVGIIKEQDPTGSSDRWYVDSGASQGFVPMGILATCNEGHSTNIYSSDDEANRGPYSDLSSPQYYYAEWAFTASSPNELTLTEGAVVTVIAAQDTEGNCEWWLVEKDGEQGYVPSTYLAKV